MLKTIEIPVVNCYSKRHVMKLHDLLEVILIMVQIFHRASSTSFFFTFLRFDRTDNCSVPGWKKWSRFNVMYFFMIRCPFVDTQKRHIQ